MKLTHYLKWPYIKILKQKTLKLIEIKCLVNVNGS